MRCPTRVANTNMTMGGFSLEQTGQAVVDLADLLTQTNVALAKDGKPGAIVSAVFQAAQPFDQDGLGFAFTDVSNDAAHCVG